MKNKIICSYYSRKYRFTRMVAGGGYRISEKPCGYLFFDNNKEIEYQYGNYKADALVVDGYVYLYRSVVELGNYDKKEKLEKCGNNVIYRLSPDGTYEEFYEFEDEDALYYDVNSKLYYYDEHFYIMIGQRVYRITRMEAVRRLSMKIPVAMVFSDVWNPGALSAAGKS